MDVAKVVTGSRLVRRRSPRWSWSRVDRAHRASAGSPSWPCCCSGIVLVYVGVHVDEGGGRPAAARPARSSDTADSAFPSGHAAYSTSWVAVAVVLTRRLRPGRTAALVMCVAWCSPSAIGADAGLPARALVVGRRRRAGDWGRRCSGCSRRSRWSSSTSATMGPARRGVRGHAIDEQTCPPPRSPSPSRARSRSSCYVGLILIPALRCYGRVWEKLAAGFLTLFILGTLLGIGAVIGLAIVWTYDRYA